MPERSVVHSVLADAAPCEEVAQRLRASGVEIIEQQQHMLMVSGEPHAITAALSGVHGWSAAGLTTVPPPRTRERVRRKP